MKPLVRRLASSVSEGKDIDWVRERTRHPELYAELEQLSLITQIREAHRAALPRTAEEGQAPTAAIEIPVRKFQFEWGPLSIVERIAETPSGEIYRAYDEGLGIDVALKLLRQDRNDHQAISESFLEEARRLARVHHRNVVAVHGAARHGGRAGIWMELIEGESLEARLMADGTCGAGEAAGIGIELCRALAQVHNAGIVHGDIKTTNVMREKGGRIVLMDFGAGSERSMESPRGLNPSASGTLIYMAPEQVIGAAASVATDIYALGVLLYRLVSGSYPVEAESYRELVDMHRRGARIPLRDRRPDLPAAFVRIVERATDPNSAKRYASAGAMERDIVEVIAGLGKEVVLQRRIRRAAIVAIAAVVVLVAGIAQRDMVAHAWSNVLRDFRTAPTRLRAEAGLRRVTPDSERGLPFWSSLAAGDQLTLRMKTNGPAYVYVLDYNAGEFHIIFPATGLHPSNPLEGGRFYRLPGALGTKAVYWNVTSGGRNETIIAIGSRQPIADLERQIPSGQPVDDEVAFPAIDPMALRGGIKDGSVVNPNSDVTEQYVLDFVAGLEARGKEDGTTFVWRRTLRKRG